jgi:biopolymer transport protein ExbB
MNEELTNEESLTTMISFSEMFEAGGPVMYILLGLSILASTVMLLKLYQFCAVGINRKKNLHEALQQWNAGERTNAINNLSTSKNPVAIVCLTAMSALNKANSDISTLKEEVARVGNREMNSLNKGMWSLELIAAVSPLLGLFGTVLGMIEAFKALQVAGSQVNPAILSGGIWQALMTTAAGLAVAIPVLMIYKWMERKIASVGEEMEDNVTQLFTRSVQQESVRANDVINSEGMVAKPSNA